MFLFRYLDWCLMIVQDKRVYFLSGQSINNSLLVLLFYLKSFSSCCSFWRDNFLLVPGVGAQGGSAEEVIAHGANDHGGLLINSSRGILYADASEDYAKVAGEAAASTARLTL